MSLTIATDGSGGNPQVAGYSAVCLSNGKADIYKGYILDRNVLDVSLNGMTMNFTYGDIKCKATNNRGELCGLLCAFLVARSRGVNHITVIMDSKYCIGIFTEWLSNWIKNGILNKKENVDLINVIMQHMSGIDVDFVHQRSHLTKAVKDRMTREQLVNVQLNELADKAAEEGKASGLDANL